LSTGGVTAGERDATPLESPVGLASNVRSLRQYAWVGLLLLVVQNATGIVLTLYVVLPIPSSFGGVFVLNALLTVHIANAFLLIVGGVLLARFGWRTRVLRLRAVSLGALVSVIVALQEGFAFTFTQDAAFSLGMEMGFLGAMILCGALLFLTGAESTTLRAPVQSAA
jgi:hypothetical protein